MSALTLRGIEKFYGKTQVLHGIDLDIAHGEFVVFVGPSGCGKSTLLRAVAGLETIENGDLSMDGDRVNDMAPEDRGVAMVFQNYALYPHMSVADNMGFALKIASTPKSEITARVERAAGLLQIEHLLDRKPRALSGGQKQRVAIGRAITRDPQVFLFDEPLSNLDAALRVQMRVELTRLHAELDATMIYVTHDQIEAMTMADKIVILRDGRVEQVGAPLDLYNRPSNRFVAGFLGNPSMNFLEGRIASVSDEATTIAVGESINLDLRTQWSGVTPGQTVTLGVRPQALSISEDGLKVSVRVAEQLGNETLIHCALENGTDLAVALSGQVDVNAGEVIGLDFDPQESHLFDAEGLSLGTN